jgi:hypothetical protein
MTVERPDWSDTPAEITPAPAAPIASPDADEDEVLTRSRQLLATGHFAPDEVQRLYFLTDDELAEVTKPRPKAPTRATVNAELAAIAETRRSDKSAYFGDEALQARERELIELREQLKADRTAADAKPAGEDIEAELAKIAKLRREDRRAYDKDEALQARERELLAAREDAKELARQTEQAEQVVQTVLSAVPDAEAFETGFTSMFTSLSAEDQQTIRHELQAPPPDPGRPANDADVRRFASTAEGAECVKEWGRDAPRKVAVVRARVDQMVKSEAVGIWFDGLPADQAKAVLKALAG